MKKTSTWSGIIGGILVAGFGYGLAEMLVEHTDMFWVNVAMAVNNLLFVALGGFLIFLFIRLRHKEEVENGGKAKPVPGSEEDLAFLSGRRNWILGFVIVVEAVLSSEVWLLNDYTAGFKLMNLAVIFDVLMHLVLLYGVFALSRGKKGMLNFLFYATVTYSIGWILIGILREHWFSSIGALVLGLYFAYAIKAPLNRKNHRIAHLVILPIFVVLLSVSSFFDNGNIKELTDREILAEQQFSNENANLNSAYVLFLEREEPGKVEIRDVLSAIEKREARIVEVVSSLSLLREEYEKQFPTISQKKTLERIRYTLLFVNIHREQARKLQELMNYAITVNFNVPTDAQLNKIKVLRDEIDAFSLEFTELQFKQDNANIYE